MRPITIFYDEPFFRFKKKNLVSWCKKNSLYKENNCHWMPTDWSNERHTLRPKSVHPTVYLKTSRPMWKGHATSWTTTNIRTSNHIQQGSTGKIRLSSPHYANTFDSPSSNYAAIRLHSHPTYKRESCLSRDCSYV